MNSTTLTNTLQGWWQAIFIILGSVLVIVLILGAIQVVAAKSDKDPERFKRLLINYIIAVIFILFVGSIVGTVYTTIKSSGAQVGT